MKYYHIFVETNIKKGNKPVRLFEFDRTDLKEILNDVVIPYDKKNEIYVDGTRLKDNQIITLKIKESDSPIERVVNNANDMLPIDAVIMWGNQSVISNSQYTTDITRDLIKEARNNTNKSEVIENVVVLQKVYNNKVFIVHGHGTTEKLEMSIFLSKAGLTPIILHEQASLSKTIIEKIESYGDVGYAVVLYTPCDVGTSKLTIENLTPRARQNVVFEHGYFIGRLGRERVSALLSKDVEYPNDISGVVYIDLDERGAWKADLLKELVSAGYEVNYKAIH